MELVRLGSKSATVAVTITARTWSLLGYVTVVHVVIILISGLSDIDYRNRFGWA